MPKIKIDQDVCTFCMTCVSVCPMGVFEEKYETIVVKNEDHCIVCRACEATCPTEAIIVED